MRPPRSRTRPRGTVAMVDNLGSLATAPCTKEIIAEPEARSMQAGRVEYSTINQNVSAAFVHHGEYWIRIG
jgi:hypothetical protein